MRFNSGQFIFAACLLIAGYCSCANGDTPPIASTLTSAESAKTSVYLNAKDAIILENGDPGFELTIKGWEPSGEFSVYAVDSDGNKLPIVPIDHALHTDEDGAATISIPYEMHGFHMGRWIILVAGKPGIHELQLTIPKVIAPLESGGKWRLDFDAAADWEKNHKPH